METITPSHKITEEYSSPLQGERVTLGEMKQSRGRDPEFINPPLWRMETNELLATEPAQLYEKVTDTYFESMEPATLLRVKSLYERLTQNDQEVNFDTEPDCTVCVPIAIHQESEESIHLMINKLAQQSIAKDTEVILYANSPIPEGAPNESSEKPNYDEKIGKVVEEARTKHPNLKLRFINVEYPAEDAKMGQIRKDYMDIVLLDAKERGFSFEHPAIWIDSDTVGLSKSALKLMSDEVRDLRTSLVHADLRYSLPPSQSGEVRTVATAVAANELSRRVLVRTKGLQHMRGTYMEESGLGISTGVYALLGGVNGAESMNETAWLVGSLDTDKKEIDKVCAHVKGRELYEQNSANIAVYVPGARLYTSARRQVAAANILAEKVQGKEESESLIADLYNSYDNFSHTEEVRSCAEPARVGEEVLRQVFGAAMRSNNWRYNDARKEKPHKVTRIEQKFDLHQR